MTPIRPLSARESALAKVQAAEDAWKGRDPERASPAYTEDSELWTFSDHRIAVRFEYEWHNDTGLAAAEASR